MKSMTGFGRAQYKDKRTTIAVEIRSINHRFFKLTCSLPEGFSIHQDKLEEAIRDKLIRGSVTLTVTMTANRGAAENFFDPKLIKAVHRDLVKVRTMTGVDGEITVDALIRAYCQVGVVGDSSSASSEKYLPILQRLTNRAVDGVLKMRNREGEHTRKDCLKHLTDIRAFVASASGRSPSVVEEYAKRLLERIKVITQNQGVELSRESIAKEVAVFADKCDISEEIARLNSHIDQALKVLNGGGEIGRRLDFLLQEMNREASTLSSKANDAELSRMAIEIKTHLEKMREQVENIE